MATTQDKIIGLYIAFFNRAPDKTGFNQWEAEATRVGEEEAIETLSSGFSAHPKFTDLYQGLSNQEFVEAIYINTLGKAGDIQGVKNWTNLLNSGVSKSDMIADFVSISLDFDPNSPQYANLSKEEIDMALKRKALISNKVEVSHKYIEFLGDKTDLNLNTDASNTSSLDNDSSFKASIKLLSSITDDRETVESVESGLSLLKDRDDAISILNSVSTINQESISNMISENFDPNSLSYINNGLGELSNSQTEGVVSIDSHTHWHKSNITFSFNQTIPDSYSKNDNLTQDWTSLNTAQQNAVRSIASTINNLLDIKLTEVGNNGDIRFNIVSQETAGFAFYPTENPDYGGDVFLSSDFNSRDTIYDYGLKRGESGIHIMSHEIGHALGLKHPFEGSNRLSTNKEDINHTVMSYTLREDAILKVTSDDSHIEMTSQHLLPDYYSLYDVSALQSIYGVNKNYHTEDNIYRTKYTDYEIQTIWDAGGHDSIDLTDTTGNTTIDLKGGTLNSVDEYTLNDIIHLYQKEVSQSELRDWLEDKITEQYNSDLLYTGKNNFAIAEGVIIEDITTGRGDDTIKDNMVDNIINSSQGDDKIYIGAGGYDHIDGGYGTDGVYLDLLKNQIEVKQLDNETYSIMADNFYAELKSIEEIHFGDGSSYSLDVLIA